MIEVNGFISCVNCKHLTDGVICRKGVEVWNDGRPLRCENNPAVWGAKDPSIYLLGFSKGGTQNQELLKVRAGLANFENIPFKGMRHRLQWLMDATGLSRGKKVEELFRPDESYVQSASLVRCSLSARKENGEYSYEMKKILAANPRLLEEVAKTCVQSHLANASPGSLFILLGLDDEYIKLCQSVFAQVFGPISRITETTYRAGHMWIAHAAHPSSNQTDPQYKRWIAGGNQKPKSTWLKKLVEDSGVLHR